VTFCSLLYALTIAFRINSLLVETRDEPTLYTLILYWSRARYWVGSLALILALVLRDEEYTYLSYAGSYFNG